MCGDEEQCDDKKGNERSLHGVVLRKTALLLFKNACRRTLAVTPSDIGVREKVNVTSVWKVARIVSPKISAFATWVGGWPTHVCDMVASFGSTVRIVSCGPVGKAGIVPTQVPAKRLCFGVGCCLTAVLVDSLASGFGFGFGFDFGVAAGVGLSGTSEIGAGSRSAVTKSNVATRQ